MSEIKEGWLCPRCKKVNSPFIAFCGCNPNTLSTLVQDIQRNKLDKFFSKEDVAHLKNRYEEFLRQTSENNKTPSGISQEEVDALLRGIS